MYRNFAAEYDRLQLERSLPSRNSGGRDRNGAYPGKSGTWFRSIAANSLLSSKDCRTGWTKVVPTDEPVDRSLRGKDIDDGRCDPLRSCGRTFAIYRSPDDKYYATDGLCTHEQVHLADGLVMDNIIECPKHNGRFDYRTGAAKGAPVCINLKTYPVKSRSRKSPDRARLSDDSFRHGDGGCRQSWRQRQRAAAGTRLRRSDNPDRRGAIRAL